VGSVRETVTSISPVATTLEIVDGCLTMEASDDEASLAVRKSEHTPLAESQPVAMLAIHGDGVEADVVLTSADVEELVAALDGDHDE
jgi:hypothetical protein